MISAFVMQHLLKTSDTIDYNWFKVKGNLHCCRKRPLPWHAGGGQRSRPVAAFAAGVEENALRRARN
jgi:hypothetical protein